MNALEIISQMIELIPKAEEANSEKYEKTLTALLAIQNMAGKIEKEKVFLKSEIEQLETRKEDLAAGYSKQLEYRNTLVGANGGLKKEYAKQTTQEQEMQSLKKAAAQQKLLF